MIKKFLNVGKAYSVGAVFHIILNPRLKYLYWSFEDDASLPKSMKNFNITPKIESCQLIHVKLEAKKLF